MQKTNAMRLLEKQKINYSSAEYEYSENDLSGVSAAKKIGVSPSVVYKTLVAKGDKNGINVFVIPVAEELDLKKAAKVSNNKKIEMLHVKDLLTVTGYIRGGCSPIGMKKRFPTFLDVSSEKLSEIYISAGERGKQIIINPSDLIKVTGASVFDIICQKEE